VQWGNLEVEAVIKFIWPFAVSLLGIKRSSEMFIVAGRFAQLPMVVSAPLKGVWQPECDRLATFP
jgi:hypothetical protein